MTMTMNETLKDGTEVQIVGTKYHGKRATIVSHVVRNFRDTEYRVRIVDDNRVIAIEIVKAMNVRVI